MPPQFDYYVRRDTWLHRLDPRVKLLFVLEAVVFLFAWPAVWSAGLMILICGMLLKQAQVPRSYVWQVLRTMLPLLVLVFLLTSLFTQAGGGAPLLQLGPFAVTRGAVQFGIMLALRLLALAAIVFLWLFVTDQATMVRGFVALGMPYMWGLTLALALRYLPIFTGLYSQVRDAQQARGLDLGAGSFWHRLQHYQPILVSMIIIAARQSEQLGWALEARALGAPHVVRTVFHPLRMTRFDKLVAAALGAFLVLEAVLRVL